MCAPVGDKFGKSVIVFYTELSIYITQASMNFLATIRQRKLHFLHGIYKEDDVIWWRLEYLSLAPALETKLHSNHADCRIAPIQHMGPSITRHSREFFCDSCQVINYSVAFSCIHFIRFATCQANLTNYSNVNCHFKNFPTCTDLLTTVHVWMMKSIKTKH